MQLHKHGSEENHRNSFLHKKGNGSEMALNKYTELSSPCNSFFFTSLSLRKLKISSVKLLMVWKMGNHKICFEAQTQWSEGKKCKYSESICRPSSPAL